MARHPRTGRRRAVALALAVTVSIAACGGDDDASPDDADDAADAADQPASGEGAGDDTPTPGGVTGAGGDPGEVTATAEPGQGVVEVDGESIVLTLEEARFTSCEISDTSINVEFAIDDGRRLSIKGGDIAGNWSAIAYVSVADSGSFQYELRFPDNAELGLGDAALSMAGGAAYMEGFSPVDGDLRPMTIAVNCGGAAG